MEKIEIINNSYNIIAYIDKNKINGYKFNKNNKVEYIDNSIFNYFEFLICSNNFTRLKNDNDYGVILDNNTNFKHYFKNGMEDYNMFFKNNGKNLVLYDKEDSKINIIQSKRKIFDYNGFIIICSSFILSLMASYNIVNNYEFEIVNCIYNFEKYSDITLEDIKNNIYSSNNLDITEKEYLYNEDYFNLVLSYVNDSNYSIYTYNNRLNDFEINSFSNYESERLLGYYDINENTINIKDYDYLNEDNCDSVAHEFVHLTQVENIKYPIIVESTAEILSSEFYNNTKINAYKNQVVFTKILMEIIGTKPILEYIYTGNDKLLTESIKPYLFDEEYETFISYLKQDLDEKNLEFNYTQKLIDILSVIYQRKFNDDINNNEIINLIKNNDQSLVRYYFNKKFINQENSYYIDYINLKEQDIDIQTAKKYNIVENVLIKNTTEGLKYIKISEEEYNNLKIDETNKFAYLLNQDYKYTYDNKIFHGYFPQIVYIDPIDNDKTLTR